MPTESERTASVPTAAQQELPTKCELSTDARFCFPPAAFARSLCAGEYPDIAFNMLGKQAPWTRAYAVRDTQAWNVTSSRSHRSKLEKNEEIVLLAKHDLENAGGGMVIIGAQPTYDVLRWDGSCVQLDARDLTLQHPAASRASSFSWSHLGEDTRHALLAQPKVHAAESAMNKACSGPATASKTSDALRCETAERAFRGAIVETVRHGVTLPAPAPPATVPAPGN